MIKRREQSNTQAHKLSGFFKVRGTNLTLGNSAKPVVLGNGKDLQGLWPLLFQGVWVGIEDKRL